MIKRINPFMIIALLFTLLVLIWLGVVYKRFALKEQHIALLEYETKAKKLKLLKRNWKQKNVLSRLNRIVSEPSIKEHSLIKHTKDKVFLSVKKLDKSHIDKLIKDLLNEAFYISKLSIKRLDEDSLELEVEVKK